VPKENQKSTRYFRGAGGTNQGLLALDNPDGEVETEKKLAASLNAFFSLLRFAASQQIF
jgi:hypothetical protein